MRWRVVEIARYLRRAPRIPRDVSTSDHTRRIRYRPLLHPGDRDRAHHPAHGVGAGSTSGRGEICTLQTHAGRVRPCGDPVRVGWMPHGGEVAYCFLSVGSVVARRNGAAYLTWFPGQSVSCRPQGPRLGGERGWCCHRRIRLYLAR